LFSENVEYYWLAVSTNCGSVPADTVWTKNTSKWSMPTKN